MRLSTLVPVATLALTSLAGGQFFQTATATALADAPHSVRPVVPTAAVGGPVQRLAVSAGPAADPCVQARTKLLTVPLSQRPAETTCVHSVPVQPRATGSSTAAATPFSSTHPVQ